jgi:autoinducer 2-degrading protein
MITTLVYVWVKEVHIADFIAASQINRDHTRKEAGNIRFDLLQDSNNPSKFIFYEAFRDEQAVADHKKTSHYLQWRDRVAEWMEQPLSLIHI